MKNMNNNRRMNLIPNTWMGQEKSHPALESIHCWLGNELFSKKA